MVAITPAVWHMASTAKVHLQQMQDALINRDGESAEREFEKAWRLMSDARRAFLNEVAAECTRDTATATSRTCIGTELMREPKKLPIP